MLQGLIEDLRYGLRVLRSSPGPTAVAVLTLALGIAANTAVFGWIHFLLLHPLPGVENSHELVAAETVTPSGEFNVTSFPDYRDIRDGTNFASGMAASLINAFNIGEDERPARVWGEYVTANYFSVLRIKAEAGRMFVPLEFGDHTGSYPYAVISRRIWQSRFHSDPRMIGKTIRLNGMPVTVIGIAPAEFFGTVPGLALDLWVPVVMAPTLNGQGEWLLEDRTQRQFWITARLQPGATVPAASAQVAAVARRIAEQHPKTNAGFSAVLLPVWKAHMGGQGLLLRPLQVLLAVCVLLFLTVAANVANIRLAQAATRRKEFSVRLAVGAGSLRLVRQLLTESLLLSLLAGAAGVLLSLWLADLLEKLLPPLNLPMSLSFSLNGEILGFTLGLCVCAAVLVGVAPALYVRRANVHESLKDAGVRSTQLAAHRARGLLVIAEVAVAFVALAGTGLFVQSFRQLRAVDPGFEARHVALAQLHVSAFCRSEEERRAFVFRLAERLRGMPGVERVGYADAIPLALGNHPWSTVQVEGYVPARGEDMRIASNEVGPGFLAALRIPLLEGRDITESDTELTPPVIVVNQAFNRRFFDGRSPVGRHVRMRGRTFTVVGMAADTRFAALTGAPKPYFYYSYRQVGGAHMWIAFFVRTRGTPAGTIPALRREIARINPQAAVAEIMPYSEYIEGAWYAQKVAATLLSGIGASCLLLAAVGIYSVLSFSVTQRRREFAIRMAMGARQRNVVMLVLRQSFRLVGAGVLSGVALALVAARTAAPLLVGVTLNDPRILGGAVALLCAVALLAVWMPVRAATRVDPMHALRQE